MLDSCLSYSYKKNSLNHFIFQEVMQEVISFAANPQLDDLESVCLVSDGDMLETPVTVIKHEYMDTTKRKLHVAVGHGGMSFKFVP
jgi:hypothetical protein